jgi:hypothetical protein
MWYLLVGTNGVVVNSSIGDYENLKDLSKSIIFQTDITKLLKKFLNLELTKN